MCRPWVATHVEEEAVLPSGQPLAAVRAIVWAITVLAPGPLMVSGPAAALPPGRAPASRIAAPFRVSVRDSMRRVDVNWVDMFTTNFGSFTWDLSTGNSGLVWPKGTGQTAVFASGLWLGCSVNGEARVAVAEYSFEYGPGSMVGGVADDPGRPVYQVYKVKRWTGVPADSSHVDRTPAELAADPLLDPLFHHGWSEYMAGAAPCGAPTRIHRLPVTTTPDPADSVDVPGPDVLGDQMLWCVYNDASPAYHTNNAGETPPLGVEVQQTTFGFDRADGLGDVVFMRFRILNRGGNTLDSLYVSLWSDPDVGWFVDDLVGCDVGRGLGFAYNAQPLDGVYGAPPPAVGYLLLRGVQDPASGLPLGMTSFNKYIGGTDPGSFAETWNYMRGLLPDGSPLIDPTTGQITSYFHPGDPVTGQGWLDRNPADRRLMLTSGPSRMFPGESQDVWAAIIVGRGPDHLNSVGTVRCIADLARTAFEQGFSPLPCPAPACSLAAGYVAQNCPRPAPFWTAECAAGGRGQLSAQQLDSAAAFVSAQSALFDWPTGARGQFCATVDPPGSPDLRQQARQEFAIFLANYAGSQMDLSIGGDMRIWLNPGTSVDCPPLAARTIQELAATAKVTPELFGAGYINNDPSHPRALEGVNVGLPFFGGGAGEGSQFFGSSLNTYDHPDSFKTVEIRFSTTATQKAYRYLRLQKADGTAPASVGRLYPYTGHYDCSFQVWDVVNNVQLDAAFVEKGLCIDDTGTLAPDTNTTLPSMDQTWDPSDDALGDREYLFILNRPYSATPKDEFRLDSEIANGNFPVLYTLTAKKRYAGDVIDDGDAFGFGWGRPPSPGADMLLHDLEGQSLSDPSVQQVYTDLTACLSAINNGIGIDPGCAFGATPELVTLIGAEATVEGVTLRWHSNEPGLVGTVWRRGGEEFSFWRGLGRVTANGAGDMSYGDGTVDPGARYDYQLSVQTAGGIGNYGLVHVTVPTTSVLLFFGARANAGDGRIVVSFSLATGEPARIEVHDVSGRRMSSQDFTGLGPGSHTLAVGEGVHFPSGIYLVRIAQGGQQVTGKAAIIR